MRNVGFVGVILNYYINYQHDLVFGDQDLVNIYFHYHPGRIYLLESMWNFRPTFCANGLIFPSVRDEGVKVLHGNNFTFYNDRSPWFKTISNAFEPVFNPTNQDREGFQNMIYKERTNLLAKLKSEGDREKLKESECGKLHQLFKIFTKSLEKDIQYPAYYVPKLMSEAGQF